MLDRSGLETYIQYSYLEFESESKFVLFVMVVYLYSDRGTKFL